MTPGNVASSIAAAAACLLAGVAASSLAAPLSGAIRPLVPRVRSGTFTPAEVRLRWEGAAILEGRLRVALSDGGTVLCWHESQDMALTTGAQTFRFLLPPWIASSYSETVTARLGFETAQGAMHLGEFDLLAAKSQQETLMLAVCDPREGALPETQELQQALRFEAADPRAADGRLLPIVTGEEQRRLEIVTLSARLRPEDMPVQPLGYCAYDGVLLAEGALGRLRERQTEALLRWVRAGGSVCAVGSGSVRAEDAAFLNALAGRGESSPLFSAGPDGVCEATGADGASRGLHSFRTGLGRSLVLLAGRNQASTLTPASVASLWKARRDMGSEPGGPSRSDSARHSPVLHSLLSRDLMGGTIRPIPFWLLGLVLAAFVVVIGPLDYWALGRIRRRRYTWLLFPLVTAGCTIATVLLANRFLGRTDVRRAVVIVDVDEVGVPVRMNRCEWIFSGRNQDVSHDVANALWAQTRPVGEPGGDFRVECRGQIPARYRMRQSLRQWRPTLNRVLSMEAPLPPVPIRWDAIDGAELAKAGPQRLSALGLRQRLVGEREASGSVYVLRGSTPWADSGPGPLSAETVRALSAPPDRGFGAVALRSPRGGPDLLDLAAYDPSDPGQWLVVIAVPVGREIRLYRRLYYEQRDDG